MSRNFYKPGRPRRPTHNRLASLKPARETFEVRIEKMVQGGEGMARLSDGRVCFVAGALPGELCKVALTFAKKDFTRGRAVEILEPSPDRVEPRCPLYGKCGGCSLQHLDSEKQAEYLARVERENFRRIARIDLPEDFKVHTGLAWGYRNRARVVVTCDRAGEKDIVRFGFRMPESNRIALFKECPVLSPALNGFLQGKAREIFAGKFRRGSETDVNLFDNGAGDVRFYCGADKQDARGPFAPEIQSSDSSCVVPVAGKDVHAGAEVFFQSNLSLLPSLVQAVRDAVDEGLASGEASNEWLIDLFSGVGFFAAMLEDKFKRVTTVERDENCLRYAKLNLSAKCESVSAPAEDWLQENVVDTPATLIVDPPRTGLPTSCTAALAASSVNRLIYVSCDPVTLARDTAVLAQSGFKIRRAEAFAFYPQTPHLEMMLVLARENGLKR